MNKVKLFKQTKKDKEREKLLNEIINHTFTAKQLGQARKERQLSYWGWIFGKH